MSDMDLVSLVLLVVFGASNCNLWSPLEEYLGVLTMLVNDMFSSREQC